MSSHPVLMHYALKTSKCQLHEFDVHGLAMPDDDIASRLKAARLSAGFDSVSEAARQLGVAVSTYTQHENGTRGIKAASAERYARRFRVSLEWLTLGRGAQKLQRLLPNEDELAEMLAIAMRKLPVGTQIGDWPHIVASSLHTQIERFLVDRGHAEKRPAVVDPARGGQFPDAI